MGFWELLQERLKENQELLKSTQQVYKFIKTVWKEGCFEVETPFTYQNEQYSFRTVIHPDADIFNYLPNYYKKRNDKKFLRLAKKHYKTHQEKVAEVFNVFESNKSFWGKLVDYSLLFANVGPAAFAIDQQTLESTITSLSLAVGSVIFRMYFKDKAIDLVFKTVMKIAKRFVKF